MTFMTDTEADQIITDTYGGPRPLPASWGPPKGCVRPLGLAVLVGASLAAYLAGQGISLYRAYARPRPLTDGRRWWTR